MGVNDESTRGLERNDFSLKVYEQVCTNIRTSDDISFKLLGLVPLISGSGAAILTLGKLWSDVSSVAIILLSLVAAIITFGLFRWELRNVQKCSWLIDRAAEIEQGWNREGGKMDIRQFTGWTREEKPKLFRQSDEQDPMSKKPSGIGKTESEMIIYLASIAAWLLPITMAVLSLG